MPKNNKTEELALRVTKLEEQVAEIGDMTKSILALLSVSAEPPKAAKGKSSGGRKATSKGKPSKSSKSADDDYVVVKTAKQNRDAVYKAMGFKPGDKFDRAKYERTARKLGVWSEHFGRVVGTYK